MIDYFINFKRLPNLIINNGENILQVNVRSNEIRNVYKYIYQDLINENRFDMNIINQLNDNNIFTYLHENSKLYSKIRSKEDFIQRAKDKAKVIRNSIIVSIGIVGFSPIPFIDVPIEIYLTAQMILMIFYSYEFSVNNEFIDNFFYIHMEKKPKEH